MRETKLWTCPDCNRKFRISAGTNPPTSCPDCSHATTVAGTDSAECQRGFAARPSPQPERRNSQISAGTAQGAHYTDEHDADPIANFVRTVTATGTPPSAATPPLPSTKSHGWRLLAIISSAVASLAVVGIGVLIAFGFGRPYRMSPEDIYSQACKQIEQVEKSDELAVSFTPEHRVERDVAMIRGRWLSLIHAKMIVEHKDSGVKLEMPWSAIVSVDHANRATTIEFQSSTDGRGRASDWMNAASDDAMWRPKIVDLAAQVRKHGRSIQPN